MPVHEINVGTGDKREKPGLLLGQRAVLLSLYLLRYTPFSLLDTFFLRRVAHPQFTESVHQLDIGRVKFQRMEPGLTGL